jgi:hypothetical protein
MNACHVGIAGGRAETKKPHLWSLFLGHQGQSQFFVWAEAGHPTPKAGKNKTIGEQPEGEIQSGNG